MNRPCVLIVDDEPINLILLESLLEDHCRVLAADSAAMALALCRVHAGDIDLIVSDVLMPDVDGYALCRQLKAQPDTRDVPILLVSSLDRETDEIEGLAAGAADLVHKPYSPELLLNRVRTQLRLRQMTQTLIKAGLAEACR